MFWVGSEKLGAATTGVEAAGSTLRKRICSKVLPPPKVIPM
jgi:hypothetical protein